MDEWHKNFPEQSRVLRLAKRISKDRIVKQKMPQHELAKLKGRF